MFNMAVNVVVACETDDNQMSTPVNVKIEKVPRTDDDLPTSESFAGRTADLIIKMIPPVVTTETIQNQSQKPVIQFKLCDPSIKEGFKHVTYFITIDKDGKKLLSDWFHDDKGDLKIEMKPREKTVQ